MAVTKAEKQTQLEGLEAAFKAVETAILVDYRGLNVPQVTELRRQLRGVKAQYKVVKNTLAKRALKGTAFESLDKHFAGTTAVAYTGADPVALRRCRSKRRWCRASPSRQPKSPSLRTCRPSLSSTPSCSSC